MEWAELFTGDLQPTEAQIEDFIASPFWPEINGFLQNSYGIQPSYSYSTCAGQPGWNIKYQKPANKKSSRK